MTNINFDDYSDTYQNLVQKQLGFFAKEEYFAEYKIKIIQREIQQQPKNILEYGCGVGRNLPFLNKFFPTSKIYGCDISEKSLDVAAKTNPQATLFLADKNIYPNTFDLVLVAGVFHHIDPHIRSEILINIKHHLKDNGELFIFEHNPYNPITRHLVNTCPFDQNAQLINAKNMKKLLSNKNFCIKKMGYTLFFPKFLQKIQVLENYLHWLPLGGQYFIHAMKNNTS